MADDFEVRVRQIHDDCEAAIREQRWDDASRGFEQLLPLLNQAGDLVGVARLSLRLGQVSEELSRRDDARRHYDEAERLARQLNDRGLRAAALHRLGHLLRMNEPQRARELFQQSLELKSADSAANALSLAMIGQIDFTEGDQLGGLDTMLTALNQMPTGAAGYSHLVEHIVHFGGKLDRSDYQRLVTRRIAADGVRNQLLEAGTTSR